MNLQITTYGEAAEELGTTYAVISGLVEARGLTPKPVPRCAGKGLDRKDMAVLRRALGLRKGEKLSDRKVSPVSAS